MYIFTNFYPVEEFVFSPSTPSCLCNCDLNVLFFTFSILLPLSRTPCQLKNQCSINHNFIDCCVINSCTRLFVPFYLSIHLVLKRSHWGVKWQISSNYWWLCCFRLLINFTICFCVFSCFHQDDTHRTGTQSRLPAVGVAPSSQIACSSAPQWWPGCEPSCLPGYLRRFHKAGLESQITEKKL